jgi:hypothetical protein
MADSPAVAHFEKEAREALKRSIAQRELAAREKNPDVKVKITEKADKELRQAIEHIESAKRLYSMS